MKTTNRRDFLKTTAAAGAGAFVLPQFSIGQAGPSANSKLNLAMIGSGNIAKMALSGCKGENIVAMCDVDENMLGQHTKGFPDIEKAKKFADFRVMLDKAGKELDGVCINTPDHTHFVGTIASMERGLHVCTQKPLTHNIWEARTLRKAMHKHNVITNMANQGHTYDGIRQMREIYEAGVLGRVKEVHMGFSGPDWSGRYFEKPASMPVPKQPVPPELDWDLWLGPAAERDYNSVYHPLTWRGFYDFGTGQFGDWFCHIGDGAVWVLDLYEPTVVECIERGESLGGMLPNNSVVRFDFPARGDKAPCTMFWYDGMKNGGTPIKAPKDWSYGKVPGSGSFWFGEEQNAYLDQRSNNPRLTDKDKMRAFKESGGAPEKYERVKGGPHAEWVRAIKGEGPVPGSNFDYSAPMSEIALIGVLAQRFGGRVEWDSKNMRVTNRPELNQYVQEPVRKGWAYGQDLWKS